MNSELEALVKALDAYFEAIGNEAKRLLLIYESLLEEAAAARPGLPRLHFIELSRQLFGVDVKNKINPQPCRQMPSPDNSDSFLGSARASRALRADCGASPQSGT
jgi:hypothetical protein